MVDKEGEPGGTTLARRAYRRPVTQPESETLLSFYRQGRADGSFEDGIEYGDLDKRYQQSTFGAHFVEAAVDVGESIGRG